MIKIRHLVTALLVSSLTISCNEDLKVEPKEPIEKISKTSLDKEKHLESVLNTIGFTDNQSTDAQNGRANGAGFQIDTDTILKVVQADSVHHTYTFNIQNDFQENSISYLVIEEVDNGYLTFILQYTSIVEFTGMANFTGSMKRVNLEDELLSDWTLENGNLIEEPSTNGRVAVENCYKISYSSECVGGWGPIYNYQNTQTTGFGCLDYETVITINSEPCAITGGSTGGQCYTCPTGGTYVPPSNPTGSGGGTTTGVTPKPKPIGVSADAMCGTGKYFDDGFGKCLAKDLNAQFEKVVKFNPYALVEIPCDQIPKWQTLAQHKPSQGIKDKINLLDKNAGWFEDWAIQTLNGANGTIVNMDYFSVSVSTLPNNPTTGARFTPEGFLDYFRKNINDFAEGSTFFPYCVSSETLCDQETILWNSNDPTGSLIYIDIPGDDGVVVCSEYTSSYWYFMTLDAPGAGNHPVSGTRQFGFEANGSGSYNFFVRGVDRFDSNTVENALYMATLGKNPFFGADALWTSFQSKMKQFVNDNSGNASINTPIKYRTDWNKVKDVVEGKKPISDLGCN